MVNNMKEWIPGTCWVDQSDHRKLMDEYCEKELKKIYSGEIVLKKLAEDLK